MDEMKIARDAPVLAAHREVGRVKHVIVDPQTKEVTDVVVAHGGRESTVPIAEVVGAGGGAVRLRDGGGAALRGDFARDDFHGIDDRTADAAKAAVATHGGAPLRAAEDDAVTIGRVAPVAAAVPNARPAPRQPARATAAGDTVTVPVVEERLSVGKREVDLGAVELRTTVTEEQVTVPIALRRDEVRIQTVAVADRPLRADDDAFNEGTIRVPLRGEEAVVAKEVVVTGEVVIDKERVLEEGHLTDTVRKEHVEVEEKTVQGTAASAQARATRKRNSPRR